MTINKITILLKKYTDVDTDKIFEKTKLREELGIKSVNIVNLIVDIEEEFNIEIDMSKIDTTSFLTVGAVCNLIESLI